MKCKKETKVYKESKSTRLRNEGNEVFKTCKKTDSPKILEQRLNLAISLYKESIECEPTKEELNKSYKNLAICYYNLYPLYPDNYSVTMSNMKDSIHYYLLCIELDKDTGYITKVNNLITELTDYLSEKHESRVFVELLYLRENIDWYFDEVRIFLNSLIAKKYLNKAIINFEKNEFKQTLSNSENCLEIAKEALGNGKIMDVEELEDLVDSAIFYINRVKGYLAIDHGKNYTTKALTEDDSLEMDYLHLGLDKLREALCYSGCFDETGRKDVELEAICYAELGYLYLKVMKIYQRAHILLSQSVNLGLSLSRNIQTEEWYKKACEYLQEIRKYNEKNESEETKKQKEAFMKELKPILTIIEKEDKEKDNIAFMKFLVEKHPPIENFKLKIDEALKKADVKKVLLRVIGCYHPDKVLSSDGKKKVLMEEICKLLNNRYTQLKG